ncbi:glycosyltransferase [Acidimicrobiia bacterium EGI L10123]|uniref:glycosyltransferase n=1 Tax=Salinilacustrithrix flava TaxID=2957203 RepID=UPI003D7C3254|nr:glycosyltransferase [Acidimicrobiia bacterium EGI L10123]
MALDGDGAGKPIRVLWLSKGLGPGGAERLLLSFARAGDQRRFAFHAAHLLPGKSQLAEPLRAAGIDVTCLDGPQIADLRWLGRFRSLLLRERIDVVHVHSPLVAAFVRPVVMTVRPRPALVSTAHNMWPSFHVATRALDRLTASLDDHLFSVSEPVHDSLPGRLRVRSEVLVHGVDVNEIEQRRKERDHGRAALGVEGKRVVLAVANLRADKDYPNLFDAAERVLGDHDDVVFLAIGQGQMEAELRTDLARRGLGDRFRMLGYQEDPIRHLVAADVFTLASRHEGLPISLLEALAAGLPAAVTAVGGVPDVITDGVEGRLVPSQDPTALAEAISELLEPETCARMSAAASERARDFGIVRAVERQQAVYEQLAARRG